MSKKDSDKKYREKHKEQNKEYMREYYLLHKDKWNISRKKRLFSGKHQAYIEKRRRTDIQYKLGDYLRTRMNRALKGQYKAGSAVADLGCSVEELKFYLENRFQEGMSWENRKEWHIDHIKPLSSFDLSNREQFLEACHYTNLQPLWAADNIRKSNY